MEIAGRNSEVIVVDQDPVSSRRAAPERIPAIPEASLGPREDSVAVRPPMRTVAHDESQQRPELVTSAEDAARCAEKDAGSGDSNTQDDHPADEAEDDRVRNRNCLPHILLCYFSYSLLPQRSRSCDAEAGTHPTCFAAHLQARESAHVANSVLFPGPSAPVQRSRDGDPAPGQSNNEPEMGPPLDPDSDDLAGTSSVLPPEEAAKAKSLQEYRALKRKLSQQILWKLYDDKGTPLAMMDDKDREKEQRRLAARQAAEATPVQR